MPQVPRRRGGGTRRRVQFGPPSAKMSTLPQPVAEKPKPACPEHTRRAKKQKLKNDPQLVAAARELRDRWLEHVNSEHRESVPPPATGKYDVSRALGENESKPKPLLANLAS